MTQDHILDLQSKPLVSKDKFRDGMANLAGAVNIVTTDGERGRAGFTATAVTSVTDTPPTLLVCLNRSSTAAAFFEASTALCVNVTTPSQADIAMAFGGKTDMAERFNSGVWSTGASGAPILQQALVNFDCRIKTRTDVGTHTVLFAEVLDVRVCDGAASIYFARNFHSLDA